MQTSELIAVLQQTILTHGDLPIGGGYVHDESRAIAVSVLDKNGCDIADGYRLPPHSIYLQG
jgi:hypothetical protein